MTSSSLRYALRSVAAAALAAALAGCGGGEKAVDAGDMEAAKAAYAARDFKKAEKLLKKALERDGENVDALVAYALVKLGLGEVGVAQTAVDRAAAKAGGDADVRLLGAQLAYHAKDYSKAKAAFAAVAADESLDAAVRAQGQSGAGVVEMAEGNVDLARIAFLLATRLDRRNAEARYHLGLLYQNRRYYEAALEQFSIFVRLEAEADARVQKVQRGAIPELKESIARQAAERPGASRRDSAAAAAALAKADAAWKKSQFKTAKLRYQEAYAADPLSYEAAIGLANAWAKTDATAAGKAKRFDCLKAACALRPSAVKTFLETGDLAMELGKWQTAAETYSRAVAANPSSFMAVDGLIRALRKVGGQGRVANAWQGYRDQITRKR